MVTTLVIQGCDVMRRVEGEWVCEEGRDIVVEGNRIRAVGPASERVEQEGARVIDGRGMVAFPGLINSHAHVAMVLFREIVEDVPLESWFNDHIWQLESNLTAEDVYWGALLGQAEMIRNGITTVADRYYYMDHVAEAVRESGMRANLVSTFFEHGGEEKLEETIRFVERWQGAADGRITTWLGPHAPYTVGPALLRRTAQRAQELGVGIHIHVSETRRQVEMSLEEHGLTPVQLLAETGVLDVPTILGHCSYPEDEDIEILSRVDAGVAHAPKTYLKFGKGVVRLSRFREAGVPVGLATDGAASNSTLDILEQLRLTALLQKQSAGDATHMTVNEALDVVFRGGAQVLQMGEELGEIEPGRLADIVLLRTDGTHYFPRRNMPAHLVYTARAADVDTVICDGKVLLEGGELLTIDEQQVRQEVSARLERLVQKAGGRMVAEYPE